mgnify:CR=1 FL=1
MVKEQFAAIMPYICADLVSMIGDKQDISSKNAISKLYSSRIYELLENEDTKVWQYSTEMLYSLFELEEKTGAVQFPDV